MRVCCIHPDWKVFDQKKHGYFFLAQELQEKERLEVVLARIKTYPGQIILDNGVYEQELVELQTLWKIYDTLCEVATENSPVPILVSPDCLTDSFARTLDIWEICCHRYSRARVMLVPHAPAGDIDGLVENFRIAAKAADWIGISILSAPIAYASILQVALETTGNLYSLGKDCREACRSALLNRLRLEGIAPLIKNAHLLGLGGDSRWVADHLEFLPTIRSIDTHKVAIGTSCYSERLQKVEALRDFFLHTSASSKEPLDD